MPSTSKFGALIDDTVWNNTRQTCMKYEEYEIVHINKTPHVHLLDFFRSSTKYVVTLKINNYAKDY